MQPFRRSVINTVIYVSLPWLLLSCKISQRRECKADAEKPLVKGTLKSVRRRWPTHKPQHLLAVGAYLGRKQLNCEDIRGNKMIIGLKEYFKKYYKRASWHCSGRDEPTESISKLLKSKRAWGDKPRREGQFSIWAKDKFRKSLLLSRDFIRMKILSGSLRWSREVLQPPWEGSRRQCPSPARLPYV